MNKALAKGFGIGILVIIISVLCMYLGLAFYYRDGFSYNTWINGVYCTGKTLDEVNEELQGCLQCSPHAWHPSRTPHLS